MNVECFGEIIAYHKYKKHIFIICEKDKTYTLIHHNNGFNLTQLLAQSCDFELINFIIREKIRQL